MSTRGRRVSSIAGQEIDGKLLENAEFMRFAAHLGLPHPRLPATPGQSQGQGRTADQRRAGELLLRSPLPQRRRLQCAGAVLLERTANARLHRTTGEVPRVRFERDESVLLKPLALRPYRSLVLAATAAGASKAPSPAVTVEHRPLASYDRLARVAR